jgi:preprotein translocase subunit SecE
VKKAINYLGEVKAELKKVTWPTRQETINSTYIVLAVVVVVSAFLAMVDGVLAWLVREIFS